MPAAGDRSASCRRVLPAGYRGSPVGMASLDDAITLLGACSAPSEAFWRLHELDAVRRVENSFRHPVLEVGCGDGVFTRLTRIPVQVGTDREPRAIGRAIERGQYERVFHLDLHAFDYQIVGLYGTVFANSVLEHVSDLELALPNVRSALMPGGRLIATVPLEQMNEHLACRHERYVHWRQRQLQHRNLWSTAVWEAKLRAAGFTAVTWTGYLPGEACRLWDRADVLATVGAGRYRVAPALHLTASRLLPHSARLGMKQSLGRLLQQRAAALPRGPLCAAVLCAVA